MPRVTRERARLLHLLRHRLKERGVELRLALAHVNLFQPFLYASAAISRAPSVPQARHWPSRRLRFDESGCRRSGGIDRRHTGDRASVSRATSPRRAMPSVLACVGCRLGRRGVHAPLPPSQRYHARQCHRPCVAAHVRRARLVNLATLGHACRLALSKSRTMLRPPPPPSPSPPSL